MTWNSTWPDGGQAVNTNRPTGQQNTTYIEETIGNQAIGTNTNPQTAKDHFWNLGDYSGHHRFVQMPAFIDNAASPADPVLWPLMNGCMYVKTTNSVDTGYYRNGSNIYEFIPTYKTGTHVITSSYTDLTTIPNNVWGEIFMWTTANGNHRMQSGSFRSTNNVAEGWSYMLGIEGTNDAGVNVKLGNGAQASGLNIRVRTIEAASGNTWNYRITYRAIV